MTPEERELDPGFFLTHQPLTLYRLAKSRYANLSGIGAAIAPGRWNVPGQEAIYTSTEIGVPVLERLVHTPKDLMPSNLALMKIRVSANWQLRRVAFIDPRTGGSMAFHRSISEAKERFRLHRSEFTWSSFAVAVPSVIVPVWNVVLYPQRAGFWDHVSLESVEPFEFDPRLFPENTPTETPQ